MSAQLPAGHATADHGDRCPLCNNGILYKIAESRAGRLLHCFNCSRSGSVHATDGYKIAADPDEGATGFTQTPEQLAAKAEALSQLPAAPAAAAPVEQTAPAENAGGIVTAPPDNAGTGEDE